MGGCVVCAHASHGKRRNGTGISAELMQIVFAFSIWAGAVTWKGTWLIPLLAHVLVNATGAMSTLSLPQRICLIHLENLKKPQLFLYHCGIQQSFGTR